MSIKNKILIDAGSSTVKVYKQSSGELSLIDSRSILFKEDFDPHKGISKSAKKELYEYLHYIKGKHPDALIEIYATAVFRELDTQSRKDFFTEFQLETGLNFKIISQELESYYLQIALIGKYTGDERMLLVNIGGGSTELIVVQKNKVIEKENLNIGVGTILNEFPKINKQDIVKLQSIKDFVLPKLPHLNTKIEIGFYSGGELNYMQLAAYPLETNSLFKDSKHPSIIMFNDFSKKNSEIFEKFTLSELEKLMPSNPKWMIGARACSALAEALFEKYNVKIIIPSNSNLVDGVVEAQKSNLIIPKGN